ncbi:CpsD/CapB family tyrosine-protein kinase [Paenibacillus daejeonensis]|uniref:CpsD/CapB family tyrosine-protein kinase n=1 Tax=Paenibacillus daejeonensis TaxID=135193 RepID=UPI0003769900|nr:CpsD/CapB family tyrosine-protein kinase [Paenibacillus daejeonensis]
MRQSPSNSQPLIMDINPESAVAEAYRAIRTRIAFPTDGKELKVIMITSTKKGEGKSSTAANIAISIAQTGKKVVLIDADMRRPALHQMFGAINHTGLANFLANLSVEPGEIVRSMHIENLYFVPSGLTPSNPAELLTMTRMDELLHYLKDVYDVIIIDTPPALSVSDAQIVAAKSDGVVVVVEYGKVNRSNAKKVSFYLNQVNAKLLGVVLNKVKRKGLHVYQ